MVYSYRCDLSIAEYQDKSADKNQKTINQE